ncbi:nitroreductase family protein [Paenibacillus sp. JX-17]|uniref:Nitroreductase family protein n=1 Tax=Paenibacillus lacisoli TaxID=3064525 RepID=A0ABT9CH64_9BACL|nr:nitroreductase family protein [Paenibacillus sp. JX-17]MDO7907928.1 nitroreductase family protein [Paenibacillus sp. JX-17]
MSQFVDSYYILEQMIEKSTNADLTMNPAEVPDFRHMEWNQKLVDTRHIFEIRESVKDYDSSNTIQYNDLLNILQYNYQFSKQFPVLNQIPVEQMVIMERVEGAKNTRAFYSYKPELQLLEEKYLLPDYRDKKDIVIQEEFAHAGAIVIFVMALREVTERYGERGYKEVIQNIGALGHYTWLQSLAFGYEGTVFAGFLQKSLREFTDIDGYNKSQVFSYAFG